MSARVPVGRLAPSPTGALHLGHARSFLFAWWHARARGGRVVLRIEDLDATRVVPGAADACLRDLEWLGLDWDGPVHVQSRELAPMRAALERLVARGQAYACVCTRKDLELAASAPHADSGEARYPGTCRGRFRDAAEAERASGRAAGMRFRLPDAAAIEIDDGLAGRVEIDVAAEVGDFLIARRDGAFAYQLAVVVDDARMGVNEVVRGADLLSSAARQELLYRALDLEAPAWFHVPLVVDPSGRRLAKRAGDRALSALRARGADPRRVVAWAARSAGLALDEPVSARDVLARFELARVPRAPCVLAPEDEVELARR